MISRVCSLFFVLFFTIPLMVAATTVPRSDAAGKSGSVSPAAQCSTGPIQCCEQLQNANSDGLSDGVAALLGLLGISLDGLDILVGVTCSPITVIGASGNSCSAQTVCCENNSFNGMINIGCTPINISA